MSSTTTTMTPEQRVAKVFQLLELSGRKEHISGRMTQLAHSLQVANLAKTEGADEETILAALMLNIGCPHLLPEQRSDTRDMKLKMPHLVDYVPDFIAVDRYEADDFNERKLGFSNKTCELVESIVLAKRYLSAANPATEIDLFVLHSLLFRQTIPVGSDRGSGLEYRSLFEQKIQLIKWDDAAAKATGGKPPALDTYRDMIIRNLKPVV
ncbi:hypothetical protein GGH92_000705 [Coemansia sp. RSA 2673]|nr:hypothetical protein H4S03_000097 [Coemansia sp. S3946]KAJ2353369.1 hypothetical protein GGH92_000705 [Coemansia sp. RSA 2673]